MTTLRNSVGERIRAIRKMKGLTQQQLAELSGLDDAYIGSVERGERNFSIDTVEKIIIALEIPSENFFISSGEMTEEQLARMKALDDYSILISDLSEEKLIKFTNVVNEISKLLD
ncbi:helix-turn-helix transcriptional regulator [Paenibacillus sp. FSL R5-0341]|uniref:helix-turn-helix domain-containing protein n=1 Tax=Paenibacillus sp. FSL R5-0341 TaxID=2921636 RepID=UPI0030CBC0EC